MGPDQAGAGGQDSHAPGRYTLVYDGACDVCQRLVGVVERWDAGGVIATLPSDDPVVRDRFPWIAPAAYAEAMQLIAPDGQTWAGAAAVERLLDLLPRGRLIGWVFRLPLAGRLADHAYRSFARNRYRFGCGDHCVTSPAPPGRRQDSAR